MMNRQMWTERIASSLEDLGSEEFQQRSWVRGEGSEVSSFEEAVNALGDFDLEGFAERASGWGYPSTLAEELLAYDKDLRNYARSHPVNVRPRVILADSKWSELRARATALAAAVRAGAPGGSGP